MDKSISHEDFEEKRKYPRIVINSPIEILYKIHHLQATIYDISPDGLQIHSDSELLEKINPDNEMISEENAPLLEVNFYIKLSGTDVKISAQCQMLYSKQLEDEKGINVVSGLKFVNFKGDDSIILDTYFSEEMTSY